MATPGHLTKSGLLYEGSDYTEWESRIRTILRVQGVEQELEGRWFLGRSDGRKDACNTLLSQTYQELRKRIPESVRHDPKAILSTLRGLASPFRFLDLPPELRIRVYEHVIPDTSIMELAPLKKSKSAYPPITAVCRLLRAETMPCCYMRSTWKLSLCSAAGKGILGRIREQEVDILKGIKDCAKRMRGENLRDLRNVHLVLPQGKGGRGFNPTLKMSFSTSHGLQLQISDQNDRFKLCIRTADALQTHVKKTEEIRSMLRLQGDGIMLALTSNDNLWEREFLRAVTR